MDILAKVIGFLPDIVQQVLIILGAFSVLAKMTPTEADDKIIASIFKFVNLLGLTKKK